MLKLAFLSACVLAAPVAAQQKPVAHIEVTDDSGQTTRFVDSEIKLCGTKPDGSITIVMYLRDRRTVATVHNVNLCAPSEQPELTLNATACVLENVTSNVAINESCSWK